MITILLPPCNTWRQWHHTVGRQTFWNADSRNDSCRYSQDNQDQMRSKAWRGLNYWRNDSPPKDWPRQVISTSLMDWYVNDYWHVCFKYVYKEVHLVNLNTSILSLWHILSKVSCSQNCWPKSCWYSRSKLAQWQFHEMPAEGHLQPARFQTQPQTTYTLLLHSTMPKRHLPTTNGVWATSSLD